MGTIQWLYEVQAETEWQDTYHICSITETNLLTTMIIHIPTGKQFANRKEAKIYFGTAYYYKLEREKRDLLFTTNVQSATNEYYQTTFNKQDKQKK